MIQNIFNSEKIKKKHYFESAYRVLRITALSNEIFCVAKSLLRFEYLFFSFNKSNLKMIAYSNFHMKGTLKNNMFLNTSNLNLNGLKWQKKIH